MTSVRVRAGQCTKVGARVSAKTSRRVDIRVVVQGDRGKDKGGLRACRVRQRGEGRQVSGRDRAHRGPSVRAYQEDEGESVGTCVHIHVRSGLLMPYLDHSGEAGEWWGLTAQFSL